MAIKKLIGEKSYKWLLDSLRAAAKTDSAEGRALIERVGRLFL